MEFLWFWSDVKSLTEICPENESYTQHKSVMVSCIWVILSSDLGWRRAKMPSAYKMPHEQQKLIALKLVVCLVISFTITSIKTRPSLTTASVRHLCLITSPLRSSRRLQMHAMLSSGCFSCFTLGIFPLRDESRREIGIWKFQRCLLNCWEFLCVFLTNFSNARLDLSDWSPKKNNKRSLRWRRCSDVLPMDIRALTTGAKRTNWLEYK